MTMTPDEIVDLLTVAAAFDQRTVGEGDAMAWHAVLGSLDFADAKQAILGYYTDNRERIMPADIRSRVKEIRNARLDEVKIPPPPAEIAHDPNAYRAAIRAATRAIADGHDPETAVQAVTRQARRALEAS